MNTSKPNFALLRQAYKVIQAVPEQNLNLNNWTTQGGCRTSCRTIACAAGWIIRNPEFKLSNYRLSRTGEIVNSKDGWQTGFDYVQELFNLPEKEVDKLFGPALFEETHFTSDGEDWRRLEKPLTDKQVWIRRIKQLFKTYKEDLILEEETVS